MVEMEPVSGPGRPDRAVSACIASAVRAAGRRLTQLYNESMAPSGLLMTQYAILNEIAGRDEAPTLGELAQSLIIERSALGQTLRPLERDGLVELRRDETDGRRRRVVVTDAGRSAMRRAQPGWQQAQDAVLAGFGAEETALLLRSVRQITSSDRLPPLGSPAAGPPLQAVPPLDPGPTLERES